MRKYFLLFWTIALLHAGSAAACDLVNKRAIQVGTSDGIAGECPNNTMPVQCLSDGDGADRFSCDGPEGTFSGPDLQPLIATACGCGATPDNDAGAQLQQELDD